MGALAVTAGLALSGAGTVGLLQRSNAAAVAAPDIGALPVPSPTVGTASGPHAGAGAIGEPPPGGHAPPLRLRIPRIGVDTALTDLQVADDGHLAAPGDPAVAGWWSNGPAPGSPGTAVLVGHVDSLTGPAVFAGLSVLRPGDAIEVDEADGSTVTFTVQALRGYAKDDFPDQLVFGPTPTPSLRLITCGGAYDRSAREYLSNLVVFAEPTPPSPTPAPSSRRSLP